MCGRYWVMDRNLIWDRTEKAFANLTDPDISEKYFSSGLYKTNYDQNITDEFIEPVRMSDNYLKDGDSLICFFRPDRARQIIKSITEKEFSDFERKVVPNLNVLLLLNMIKIFPSK